ncbi:unknown protein [Seminavis robusta]|uniref:Uncharacterized protein n=1 Tax=Seminavis robusta TaxID=568900 RepID=A0A9N8EPS8_9STRA|nr:unknown protein [Seminavis robusta]|eukprot:Sro1620_g286500.1 n/a (387) ;mRNA; r:10018-14245
MEWNLRQSNQVDLVNEVIKEVKKAQTHDRCRKSRATRDLTEAEYCKVVHELYNKATLEASIRTTCMLKQVHLITRTDDISRLKYSDYKPHPDFHLTPHPDFHVALSCKVHGSKNISEERQCPDQIFCAMLGLAFYMDASFNYGYDAAGPLYPGKRSQVGSQAQNEAYRGMLNAVFCQLLAVAVLIAGVLGSHSIRKFAATLARGWVILRKKLTSEVPGRFACLDELLMSTFHLSSPESTSVLPTSFAWGRPLPMYTRFIQMPSTWEERMGPLVHTRIEDNTKLHINEIEPMDTGGGGTVGGTMGTGQANTHQVANESRWFTAVQTQQQVRTNQEIPTRIIAQHNQLQQLIAQEGRTRDSSAAALRGWLAAWLGAELRILNGNILCR